MYVARCKICGTANGFEPDAKTTTIECCMCGKPVETTGATQIKEPAEPVIEHDLLEVL